MSGALPDIIMAVCISHHDKRGRMSYHGRLSQTELPHGSAHVSLGQNHQQSIVKRYGQGICQT